LLTSQLSSDHFELAVIATVRQLSKEYVAMQNEPPPFIWAVPDEKNILTCASSTATLLAPPTDANDRSFALLWLDADD
jgi:hypothetical protein